MARFQSDLEFRIEGVQDIDKLKKQLEENSYTNVKLQQEGNTVVLVDDTFEYDQFEDYQDIEDSILEGCDYNCSFKGSVSYYQMNADGEYTYDVSYKDGIKHFTLIEAPYDTPCSAYCDDCDEDVNIDDWRELPTLEEDNSILVVKCPTCGKDIPIYDQPVTVSDIVYNIYDDDYKRYE